MASLFATRAAVPRHVGRVQRRSAGTAVRASAENEQPAVIEQPKKKVSGPKAERFKVADGQLGNVAGAALPFVMRAGSGALASGYSVSLVKDEGQTDYTLGSFNGQRILETSKISTFARPEKPLEIYEFEGCPFCKKVREAVSILDLEVIFRPCPQGGSTWRPKAIELGGKKMFPYMVDPNTDTAMYESDDIIKYLFTKYGDGEVPLALRLGAVTALTAGLGLIARGGAGSRARPSKLPEQPLVLWGYEASPFVKLVRERLCELEIPYLLKPGSRGSPRRDELMALTGTYQAPFLEDPNTGESMFESAYIVEYIEKTYAA